MAPAPLIDTHCHVQRDTDAITAATDAVQYCPMAVDEGDWAVLPTLSGVAAYGLGVHPWRAHLVAAGWEERLEAALKAQPKALVGEIGLDKAVRTPETGETEWESQLAVFKAQMRLAGVLGRPVSVHCVRAHGALYEVLKDCVAAPPTVALHSYTGSPDMAVSLLKLARIGTTIFFGFSAAVNLKTPTTEAKLQSVVERIPADRILLESDLDSRREIPTALARMCEALAAATGMERPALVEVCQRNAARFLRRRIGHG